MQAVSGKDCVSSVHFLVCNAGDCICSLLCLRQSTAYTQAKVFRACSSLIFLTGLVAIHFCMWLWIWTCNQCFFDPTICWVDSIWDAYVMESVPLFLLSDWKCRSLGKFNGLYVLLRHNYDISGAMRSRIRPIHALVQNDFDIRSLLSLLPHNSLDIPYLTHILDRESYLWFKTIEIRLFGGLLLFMDPTCWQSKSFHYIQKDWERKMKTFAIL